MAVDKLVDSGQLDSDLEDVADAIRAKSGSSGSLAFPSGFISEIGNIQTGGGGIKGSFTVPSGVSNYSISFGKTISKYLCIIQADSDSIDDILDTGLTTARAYAFFIVKPALTIGNDVVETAVVERIKPSDSSLTVANITTRVTLGDTSITIDAFDLTNTNAPSFLYRGLTYNYYVFEME